MSSELEMSLEEIIKKKKLPSKPTNNKPRDFKPVPKQQKNTFRGNSYNKKPADARNKIISKKRTQITDAREKLAELAKQKDARLKLEQMRLKKAVLNQTLGYNLAYPNIQDRNQGRYPRFSSRKKLDQGFMDTTRQVRSQPFNSPMRIHVNRQIGYTRKTPVQQFTDFDDQDYDIPPLKPILRTVENDVIVPKPIVIEDEYEPIRLSNISRNLNLKIIAHNDEIMEKPHGSLRKASEREKGKNSVMPPSILKKRPMAALRADRRADAPPAGAEYRIVVSNLRSSVTGNDIQELFGDVGGLVESRLVRPGTAEVMYGSLEDAQRAVELYHNRQLDGQPMNCLLVNPRSSHPSHPSGQPRSGGSKSSLPPASSSSVVPDISTFHKVLFSKH